MQKRSEYEALDDFGLPYKRPARCIGELPHAQVNDALAACTKVLSKLLCVHFFQPIQFGAPVYKSVTKMNSVIAKAHRQSNLLMTLGDHISLDFVHGESE